MAASSRSVAFTYGSGLMSTVDSPSPRKRGRPPNADKRQPAPATNSVQGASSNVSQQESEILLPISRIRTIMKSSPDVVQIGHESLLIMTKATEYFIQHLARESFKRRSINSNHSNDVEYQDLASYVQSDQSRSEFLREIIPHKVKVRDLASMATSGGDDRDHYDDDDESSR